jgi:Mn-dependent DtxR family transcriptional regulator
MKAKQLIKIKEQKYLKAVLETLFLNQGSPLREIIVLISSRLNISTKVIEAFVRQLYRNGFLIISRDKYAFTFEGNLYFLSIFDEDLRDGEVNEK